MSSFINIFESIIIVGSGIYMHLYGFSIFDHKHSNMPSLQPNSASTLFVLSTLCFFSKLRAYWWPRSLKKPAKLFAFLIDLGLSLYATDLLVRKLWISMVQLLDTSCTFLGRYILVGNQEFLKKNAPTIDNWIRNDGFVYGRFMLALGAFFFMIQVTGAGDVFKKGILKNDHHHTNNASKFALMDDREIKDCAEFMEHVERETKRENSNSRSKKRNSPRKNKSARKRNALNLPLSKEYHC